MKKLTGLLFIFFLLASLNLSAQQRSLQVGAKLINDLTLYNGYAPGVGG